MSVQQNKKTPSKRGMRRSHDFLKIASFSIDKFNKKLHLRHHVSKDGFYKGKKVIFLKKNNNKIKKK